MLAKWEKPNKYRRFVNQYEVYNTAIERNLLE